MYPVLIAVIVLLIYIAGYMLHGKALLERRVVKADPKRLTPAVEKFDGVDYVPANKYVLYGHHFASIAGAGPIIGPALALAWGWLLPLVWVLFGNIFIGAVHDYLAIMASVRYGGVSIMTISENVMGRKARYIFLAYVWFALVLVLAAFLSVASSTYVIVPTAATMAIMYMPIALLFGLMVYKIGIEVRKATAIALILSLLALLYAFNAPTHLTYEGWIVVLSIYSILAAALPVWYLLQPRDYLNAYLLWTFVALAVIAPFLLPYMVTGPAITAFTVKGDVVGAVRGTPPAGWDIGWFWPMVPLVIACGALSGFHSVVGSGTTSKQLSNELDALLVGYGGMLTEGAVSSLAVILPAALVWDFASIASAAGVSADLLLKAGINITATPTILRVSPVAARFYTAYGFAQALAWSRIVGIEAFPSLYRGFYTFAAWALTAFILTTLDTANRIARFAWTELFDWVKPKKPRLHKFITNRWFASFLSILIAATMAYPKIPDPADPTRTIYAYSIVWPAFAGTNQLLAALALLTSALWTYAILKVRGGVAALTLVPALFLWITVTGALIVWLVLIVPYLPLLYIVGTGTIVAISVALDIALIALFVRRLLLARKMS